MADLAAVETAIATRVLNVLYPNGVANSTTPSPVASAICDIRRGWPVPEMTDVAMANGSVLVTVHAEHGMARNTTRYPPTWQSATQPAPTLTVSVSGLVVTFGGTGGTGQVAGVGLGSPIRMNAYSYRLSANDTPTTVAAAFASAIPGASSVGAVLTLTGTKAVMANVVTDTTAAQEVRRQDQGFCVAVWCANPTLRDTVAAAIDVGFAGMTDTNGNLTYFLPLADGSSGFIRYRGTRQLDAAQLEGIWRRDLLYMVEYPTENTVTAPAALWAGGAVFSEGVITNQGALQPAIYAVETMGNLPVMDGGGNMVGTNVL